MLLFALACAPDYGLSSTPGTAEVDADPWQPIVVDGSAVEAWEDDQGQVKESFALGGEVRSPLVDYLFVIDDSVSMDAVIDRVQVGFAALAEERWPARSRIAVTSMLPASYEQPKRLHPAVRGTTGLYQNPGFRGLVDGSRIAAYKRVAEPIVVDRMPYAGCDPWFAPDDVSDEGVSCLVAHTQVGLTWNRAEAGLNALKQLLEQTDEALFRPGAAANVVFVSDTHDPGFFPKGNGLGKVGQAHDELVAERPDFDELAELVAWSNTVSSFRVHAIAPATPCAEAFDDPAYFEVAEASGGALLDICSEDDYSPLLGAIATEGARLQEPVVALSVDPGQVAAVTLDGEPVGYSVEGRALRVDTELRDEAAELQVVYRRAPERISKPVAPRASPPASR